MRRWGFVLLAWLALASAGAAFAPPWWDNFGNSRFGDPGFNIPGGGLLPTVQANFLSGALPPWLSFSRTGNAMMYDATGTLTYAPNNLFTNSASLSTQGVTTTAANYIVAFYGAGAIALSGSCSGSFSGSNPSYVKFTATAGTCTATVTGSVTNATFSIVTYETTPRSGDQVVTTSSAYYGPRFDYNPATLSPQGLLIEESRANLGLYSQTLTNVAWGLASVTYNGAVTDPSGTTTAADISFSGSSPTFNSAPAFYQNYTFVNTTTYTLSAFIRTVSGTGKVRIGAITGSSVDSGDLNINTTWQRFSITFTANGTSGNFSIRNDSLGTTNRIYIADIQLEAGSFPTSYIPTTSAPVTRAADVAQLTGLALSTFQGSAFSVAVEAQLEGFSATASLVDVGAGVGTPLQVTATNTASTYNNSSTLTTATGSPLWTSPARAAFAGKVGSRALAFDGGTVVTDSNNATGGAVSAAYLGSQGGTTAFGNGWYRSIGLYNGALNSASVKAVSTVGASYTIPGGAFVAAAACSYSLDFSNSCNSAGIPAVILHGKNP
jgi:hypothetical protein